MDKHELRLLLGFYENELVNKLLAFWLPRCEDKANGGFFNCFDNNGEKLLSRDKYTWSQGRFVWIFSKLATTTAPIFSASQRQEFLRLARQGAEFLMKNCLLGNNDWRAVFLMNEYGEPKYVEGCRRYDMSISADHFVIGGLALCSYASGERRYYDFAKNLYLSAKDRLDRNDFESLPYPLRKDLRCHGMPMIMSNITKDMVLGSRRFDPGFTNELLENMRRYSADVLDNFVDRGNLVHEIIKCDNEFFPQMFGQQINPGHSCEDSWFMLDTVAFTGMEQWRKKICSIVLSSLDKGWDKEFGGILHYASVEGGKPAGDNSGYEDEPMSKQLAGWGDKLWWVHSEALYATLRCYLETGDERFKQWHDRIFDYAFETFPQKDPEIREWIQIRDRQGRPKDCVVALPVKDPYHIMRNFILIIELLCSACQ